MDGRTGRVIGPRVVARRRHSLPAAERDDVELRLGERRVFLARAARQVLEDAFGEIDAQFVTCLAFLRYTEALREERQAGVDGVAIAAARDRLDDEAKVECRDAEQPREARCGRTGSRSAA